MTYLILGAAVPVWMLVWSGRLVAAHSAGARQGIIESGAVPATAPPSAAGALVSGVVGMGALGAIALLSLQTHLSLALAALIVVPFAAALSYVVRPS